MTKVKLLRWVSILLVVALAGCASRPSSQPGQPTPSRAPATAVASPAPSSKAVPTKKATKTAHPSSAPAQPTCSTASGAITPTRITVPSVGIDVPVNAKPLNPDGSLPVPVDTSGNDVRSAATWVDVSPRPGNAGVADFTTHSYHEGVAPGNRLQQSQRGEQIQLYDSRGRKLCFRITDIELDYDESKLPSDRLYDSTGTPRLAIIFCTHYNWVTGEWAKRGIVFATIE